MKRTIPWIARRIRAIRTVSGISAREVDRLAGLGLGHTAQIESGARRNSELATLAKIAAVFSVSLDWLVRGHGAPPTESELRAAVEMARLISPDDGGIVDEAV